LLALFASALSPCRLAARALLAFFVPELAAPRPPLLRLASSGVVRVLGFAADGVRLPFMRRVSYLLLRLLLLRPRLLDDLPPPLWLPLRLPLPARALARSEDDLLLLLAEARLLLLACLPAPLILLPDDEDLEELRSAMVCSFFLGLACCQSRQGRRSVP
jgi:hypothetical protein